MRELIRVLCLCCAALILAACANRDTSDPPSPLVEFEEEAVFKTLWSTGTGSGNGERGLKLQPWVGTESIYIADHKGVISAYNKENGEQRWQIKTKLAISSGVGGNASMLFVATRDGELLAFWQRDGTKVWQTRTSSEVLAPPVANQNIVVTRSVDGNLEAFALSTGDRLWSNTYSVPSLSLRGTATPLLFYDVVIVGTDSGRLAIIAGIDGRLLREIPVAVPSGASDLERMVDVDIPVIVDPNRIAYIAAFQGRVIAIALQNAQTLWSRKMSVHQSMAHDFQNLYVVDDASHVWALSKADGGSSMWIQEKLHARPVSGVGVFNNAVILGDFEGYLHALDTADGRFIARARVGDAVNVAPLIEGNIAYILSADGNLSALQFERIATDS